MRLLDSEGKIALHKSDGCSLNPYSTGNEVVGEGGFMRIFFKYRVLILILLEMRLLDA